MQDTVKFSKLTIRPTTIDNSDIRLALFGNLDDCSGLACDPLINHQQATFFVASLIKKAKFGAGYHWTLDHLAGSRSIGFIDVNINPLLSRFGICELTYGILQEFRKQGLIKEALTTCIDFLFENGNFYRIEAYLLPSNVASLALLQNLGFQSEGLQRQKWLFNKERYDVLLASLIKSDWNQS